MSSPPYISDPSVPPQPGILTADSVQWFEAEVRPCEPGLRGWLRKRFPWITDIDDLVQETYLRIFRAKARGKVDHARSYLYATANHAAVDLVRRKQRTLEVEISPLAADVMEEGPLLAEAVCHAEEIELLAEAVRELPQKRRVVLMLCKLQGLSHREIADKLEISENTVSAHLTLAMRQCREYLEDRGVQGGGS